MTDTSETAAPERQDTENPATVKSIPTDDAGLEQFIVDTRPEDRWLIAAWLKQQEGGDWEQRVDHIIEAIVHSNLIDHGRKELRATLADAARAVAAVRGIYHSLAVELYDVEYAEGGFLFKHYLEQADLAIRTAAEVNPIRD